MSYTAACNLTINQYTFLYFLKKRRKKKKEKSLTAHWNVKMISGKINNTQMVVILLLCKKTHYLFHNNWLIFWGMSLISMVLFRLLILICKMLGKNLTSSYILQEIRNLHLINHPYSQSDNFHLKNWSPLNTFKIKNQRYVPELKKKKKTHKMYLLKEEKSCKNRKSNLPFQTYFVPFWDALPIFHSF